jgi:uncharacterized membrane protein YdbT with pleckstrin-like domain
METEDHTHILAIERPHRKLMTYYFLTCLFTGPLFPILILPAYFRYHTMRYKIGAEGVSMRWGLLFRKEIILNYARIQDIHLSSNIVERWLGLARLQIQTASGSSSAEMTIEGVLEYEALRDFLYSKMRGLKQRKNARAASSENVTAGHSVALSANEVAELTQTLREAANELRLLREQLPQKPVTGSSPQLPPDLPRNLDA